MSYRFIHEVSPRWSDIDASGVLNSAVYLTLLEEARYHYFRRLESPRGDAVPFLVGETCIRFLKPARAGRALLVAARTERVGSKSLDMAYEVRAGSATLAVAVATLVWVDEDLRSTPIPEAVRRELDALEGQALKGPRIAGELTLR